jgi:hypothetical protein
MHGLMTEAYAVARSAIGAHRVALNEISRRLLEHEVVNGDEVRKLLAAGTTNAIHAAWVIFEDDPRIRSRAALVPQPFDLDDVWMLRRRSHWHTPATTLCPRSKGGGDFARSTGMTRFLIAVSLVLVVISGCALPPPITLIGSRADIESLTGEWSGTYESRDTRREGSIWFSLSAGAAQARGDGLQCHRRGRARLHSINT